VRIDEQAGVPVRYLFDGTAEQARGQGNIRENLANRLPRRSGGV
jgi:hypothetical protein